MNIIEALKIKFSMKWSKFNVSTIDYNRIQIQKIKYLPISFDSDIIFFLLPLPVKVSPAHSHGMDGIEKTL
jgi:hypothetical protein